MALFFCSFLSPSHLLSLSPQHDLERPCIPAIVVHSQERDALTRFQYACELDKRIKSCHALTVDFQDHVPHLKARIPQRSFRIYPEDRHSLAGIKAERRILVAGEMLELGPLAEELHRESGQHAAKMKIDLVLGVRGLAKALAEAACGGGVQAQFLETPEQAGEVLARLLRPGDAVLLKASRGVKLERALEVLQQKVRGGSI